MSLLPQLNCYERITETYKAAFFSIICCLSVGEAGAGACVGPGSGLSAARAPPPLTPHQNQRLCRGFEGSMWNMAECGKH